MASKMPILRCKSSDDEYDSEEGPYGVEPLADEEYLGNYNRVVREQAQEEERLTRHFQGIESLVSWCVLFFRYCTSLLVVKVIW